MGPLNLRKGVTEPKSPAANPSVPLSMLTVQSFPLVTPSDDAGKRDHPFPSQCNITACWLSARRSPTAQTSKASIAKIDLRFVTVPEESILQIAPPSVVLSMVPLLPTAHPNVEFTNETPFKFTTGPGTKLVQLVPSNRSTTPP